MTIPCKVADEVITVYSGCNHLSIFIRTTVISKRKTISEFNVAMTIGIL